MSEQLMSLSRNVKLSQLAVIVARDLEDQQQCVSSDYAIFLKIVDVYRRKRAGYLRGAYPTLRVLSSVTSALKDASLLARDRDYGRSWRVRTVTDGAAEEVACLLDPFCYVSHLSAMQRYGLTNRRPEFLHLTQPAKSIFEARIVETYARDLAEIHQAGDAYKNIELPKIKQIRHPANVRNRKLHVKITIYPGPCRLVRGTSVRVGTIGQVFCDMLEDPMLCGGMSHVVEIWQSFAQTYLNEVIEAVSESPKAIVKVRAGYLLEEKLGISDRRIDKWLEFAQRGGSRMLDPTAEYIGEFSEKWMISINVGP